MRSPRILRPALALLLAAGCQPRNPVHLGGLSVDAVEVNGREVARNLDPQASITACEGDRVCVRFSLAPDLHALAATGLTTPEVVVRVRAEGYAGPGVQGTPPSEARAPTPRHPLARNTGWRRTCAGFAGAGPAIASRRRQLGG